MKIKKQKKWKNLKSFACVKKTIGEFKIDQFPEDIKDGDVVILENEKFKIDKEESKTKKQQIEELMKKLMKG